MCAQRNADVEDFRVAHGRGRRRWYGLPSAHRRGCDSFALFNALKVTGEVC
jgi:hypothetical protein